MLNCDASAQLSSTEDRRQQGSSQGECKQRHSSSSTNSHEMNGRERSQQTMERRSGRR